MNDFTTADKVAAFGGGLIVLGVVVIGILEIAGGAPHPVTSEGQIEHKALVPLAVRSYIIILGLLTWAVYGVYKVVATTPAIDPSKTP